MIPHTKILWALKRLWLYSKQRSNAIKAARVSRGQYSCKHCKGIFGPKEIECDHVNPIGSFNDYDTYIKRLFEGELQILCRSCHLLKSNQEKLRKS